MVMQVKKCVDCGEPFFDESMFGQLPRCDSCSMKHCTGIWKKDSDDANQSKAERLT